MHETHLGVQRLGDLRVWSPERGSDWPWLAALVTTRHGGTSLPPFASLNLGLASGDDPRRVHDNRARLCQALGLEPGRLRTLHQVHGDTVLPANSMAGEQQGDGLWTGEPGVVLVVGIADCVPVFVFDTCRRRVALVHAGWRGTAAGILGRGMEALRGAGSSATDLWVAMGPSIGPCCYQVSPQVASHFPREAVHERHGTTWLDLRAANRRQAIAGGVPPAQVLPDPPCTACHTDTFYSYRQEGQRTGRMWALVWIRV